MRFFLLLLGMFPIFTHALEQQPWFSDVYQFHFLGSYTYSRFPHVNRASPQLTHSFNSNLVSLGLDFSFAPEWSIDGELEIADTTKQDFGFRAIGLQMRYLWYDDIIGDSVSLATSANVRYVSSESLKDVSCPYQANCIFQANFSIGKELDYFEYWRYRIWAFGQVGVGNRGSPFFEGLFAFEGNYDDFHKWGIFLDGGHGYGRKTKINPNSFFGYGKVRYKYLDIAFRYGRRLGVWGTLRFEYARRLIAGSYPEDVNFFTISYLLPFSF